MPGPLSLRIAAVVPDTDAEGPGRRFAVWVQGCSIRCPGCCNPEMFEAAGGEPTEPALLAARAIATPGIEGVSVLGGEPFEQAAALVPFARAVRAAGLSVMVFTGYTLEALRARGDADVDALLATCDLLIDGPFEARRLDRTRRWIGSTNQRVHALTTRARADDPRFAQPEEIEIRLERGVLTVNGWPAGARRVVRSS